MVVIVGVRLVEKLMAVDIVKDVRDHIHIEVLIGIESGECLLFFVEDHQEYI